MKNCHVIVYVYKAVSCMKFIQFRRISRIKMASQDTMWSFGYGSNMDVKAVETKKKVKIIDHTAAILKGWKLAFNLSGIPLVEPAYANVTKGDPTDEVHGVAFCMTKDSIEQMDRVESGYNKAQVTLEAYDGRKLDGFVYVNKPSAVSTETHQPSSRYVGVLVKGAKQAGLSKSYIENLQKTEVYKPSAETLKLRESLPKPDDLPAISVEELAKHDGKDEKFPTRVAVLGYVMQPGRSWFGTHRGRDRTTRFLMQYHGLPLDDNEDFGKPPYPLLDSLTGDEKEYISRWMDHYLSSSNGKAVGYVKEFREQQKSGQSVYQLPK
ncbi:hypothetical protein LOTGIDRAFT_232618 [Lottia gigantea]|uniref:gamma-glutamylcyclotransferase n=1 Tax=Lottia gigantea TaxID=225164 RepID=V4A9X2_LOTGI|nr:hypothetical protein LOTGIDRAFT_232618 [Lottia gigantea]ESO93557.1 hypothetical protein LOTGIDRAFT_232618 [Lottia gigantea]